MESTAPTPSKWAQSYSKFAQLDSDEEDDPRGGDNSNTEATATATPTRFDIGSDAGALRPNVLFAFAADPDFAQNQVACRRLPQQPTEVWRV